MFHPRGEKSVDGIADETASYSTSPAIILHVCTRAFRIPRPQVACIGPHEGSRGGSPRTGCGAVGGSFSGQVAQDGVELSVVVSNEEDVEPT